MTVAVHSRCPLPMEAPAPVSAIEDGSVAASAAARAVFEAGAAVDGAEFALMSNSESETDEGTYCQSSSHALSFRGETVWSFSTTYTANIGGARGTSSSCSIEGNQLVVELSRGRTLCSRPNPVFGGRKGQERRRYPLGDLLIRAAVAAGAPKPEPGSTIPVQPASYRVLRKAAIRSGIEAADSSIAGSYHPGDVIMAQEHGTNRAGVARLRTGRGWISNKPDIVERTALPTAAKLLAFSKILHPRLAPPDALVDDRDVIGEVARHFRLADAAQLVDEAELAELAQRRERNRGHTASNHALVEVDVDDAA